MGFASSHVLTCRINIFILFLPVDWTDNSRDILNFLVNYLPLAPTNSALPTHLPRTNSEEAESRKLTGYKERTLVVVGHSFGGTTSYVSLRELFYGICVNSTCIQCIGSNQLPRSLLLPYSGRSHNRTTSSLR